MTATTTAKEAPRTIQSRVGKRPVELLKGVTASIANGKIEIKGPKGTLSRVLPGGVDVKVEGSAIVVKPVAPGRDGARLQGLARALINSMVTVGLNLIN